MKSNSSYSRQNMDDKLILRFSFSDEFLITLVTWAHTDLIPQISKAWFNNIIRILNFAPKIQLFAVMCIRQALKLEISLENQV